MNSNQIIRRPLVTEKSTMMRDAGDNILAFEVDVKANKIQVKSAIEELFKVKVQEVRLGQYLTSSVAGFQVQASSQKTGAPVKAKVVGRRSLEEAQFLDDLVSFMAYSNGRVILQIPYKKKLRPMR